MAAAPHRLLDERPLPGAAPPAAATVLGDPQPIAGPVMPPPVPTGAYKLGDPAPPPGQHIAGPQKGGQAASYHFHSSKVFDWLAIAAGLFALLLVRVFKPSFLLTSFFTLVGLPIGLAYSFLFYQRRRTKTNIVKMVRAVRSRRGGGRTAQPLRRAPARADEREPGREGHEVPDLVPAHMGGFGRRREG